MSAIVGNRATPPAASPTITFNLSDPKVAAALRAYACHGVSEDGDDRGQNTVHPDFVKDKDARQALYPLLVQDLINKVSSSCVCTIISDSILLQAIQLSRTTDATVVVCTIPCERRPDHLEDCKFEVYLSPFIVAGAGTEAIDDPVTRLQEAFYDLAYQAGVSFFDRLKGYNWKRQHDPNPLATITQDTASELVTALMGSAQTSLAIPTSVHPSSSTPSASAGHSSSSTVSQPPAASTDDNASAPVYSNENPVPWTPQEGKENIALGFKAKYRQPGGVKRFSDQKPNHFFDSMVSGLELKDTEILYLRLLPFQQLDPTTWFDWIAENIPSVLEKPRHAVDALLSSLVPDEDEL